MLGLDKRPVQHRFLLHPINTPSTPMEDYNVTLALANRRALADLMLYILDKANNADDHLAMLVYNTPYDNLTPDQANNLTLKWATN